MPKLTLLLTLILTTTLACAPTPMTTPDATPAATIIESTPIINDCTTCAANGPPWLHAGTQVCCTTSIRWDPIAHQYFYYVSCLTQSCTPEVNPNPSAVTPIDSDMP